MTFNLKESQLTWFVKFTVQFPAGDKRCYCSERRCGLTHTVTMHQGQSEVQGFARGHSGRQTEGARDRTADHTHPHVLYITSNHVYTRVYTPTLLSNIWYSLTLTFSPGGGALPLPLRLQLPLFDICNTLSSPSVPGRDVKFRRHIWRLLPLEQHEGV